MVTGDLYCSWSILGGGGGFDRKLRAIPYRSMYIFQKSNNLVKVISFSFIQDR